MRLAFATVEGSKERGLDVIMHVPGGPLRDDAKHLVSRVVGIGDDLAVAVIAHHAPARGARLEVGIRQELLVGATGILLEGDVIDQDLTGVEEAHREIAPEVFDAGGGRSDVPVGVGLPRGLGGLIAVGPRLRDVVIGVEVTQFETGASAVGELWPAGSVVKVAHLVHRIAIRIPQGKAFSGSREAAPVLAEKACAGKGVRKFRGALRQTGVFARGQNRVGREGE